MFRLVIALALMLSPSIAAAADWTMVASKTRNSVVEIAFETEDGKSSCTGFVIDDDRDFVLTAAHCFGENLFADSLPVEVSARDEKRDLMVLHVKGIDRPSLRVAKKAAVVGEEVASYGYGKSLEQPLFRVTHISAKDIAVKQARYTVVDTPFVGGQSGGPVVNSLGEVVMIVQLGDAYSGLGVDVDVISDKLSKFFAP